MGSILFKAILGMIAGAIGWALVEPFKPNFTDQVAWGLFESALMISWAAWIGVAIGAHSGYSRGSKSHMVKEALLGSLFGAIGMMVGKGMSGIVVAMNPNWMNQGVLTIVFRTLIFTIIGAGLGLGIGINTFVVKRGLQGLVGGAIGGAIAGGLFDIVGGIFGSIQLLSQGISSGKVGEVGGMSRALSGILMGGAIALMIGIVEALSKSAWLRLELGRNEGKEWVIDKQTMFIGRHERADVPLFGDPNISPQHARIEKQGIGYVVFDMGTPIGIGVNGQRISQANLQPGDVIQIGTNNLVFQIRGVAAPYRGPEPGRGSIPVGFSPNPVPYNQASPTGVTGLPSQQMSQSSSQPTMVQSMLSLNIVILDGPMTGHRFSLPVELGRESTQVPMSYDSAASRRHARLEAAGNFVNVIDLGSTNGTFVNGLRVQQATAKIGDLIKVGSTTFRIEST
jgi:pSer/pThr/pTyr-binding forkhead associated (FHA) protein